MTSDEPYRKYRRVSGVLLNALCLITLFALANAGMAAVPARVDGHSILAGTVNVPEQVALIVEADQVLASNTRLGRIDPCPLEEGETVLLQTDANASLAVATNQRILAYGPVIGWRTMELLPGETVESLQARDYAVFIITDQRYLNFNADAGIWGRQSRPAP